MTELEKVQRAKMYIDKLANGVDPLTDAEVPQDGTLNNVRLSRCFFFVSDLLRRIIENGGEVGPAKRPKRADFELTPGQRESFPYSREPLPVSRFVELINGLVDAEGVKKLTTTAVTGWLLEAGFLAEAEYPDGKKRRQPTEEGRYIGLSQETRQGLHGEYQVVLYNGDAQRFVLDNLDAVLRRHRERPSRASK